MVIDSMFANDNDGANKGSFLAVTENTINYLQSLKIQHVLDLVESLNKDEEWLLFSIDSATTHITFSDSWNQFIKAIRLYKTALSSAFFSSEINQTTNEINKTIDLNNSLQRQIQIYTKELNLNKKERDRNIILLRQGVLSDSDFEKQETNYLSQSRQLEIMKSSKIINEIGIEKLKALLAKTIDTYKKTLAEMRIEVLNLSQNCRNQLAEWKNINLYISPASGNFVWAQKFSSKQYLTAGSLLGTIVPDIHRTKIMAYAKIPSTDLVEVYKGVEVQLMPQIYPLLDYGFISGKVSQVSLLPLKVQKDSKAGSADYIITIVIDTSLISSTGQKMEYKPKMVANIKIFTKNRSILTKIFEPIIKLLKFNK